VERDVGIVGAREELADLVAQAGIAGARAVEPAAALGRRHVERAMEHVLDLQPPGAVHRHARTHAQATTA